MKIRKYQISEMAGISPAMLSEILHGNVRPSWGTAKRLSSIIIGTTPDQWMEAPHEYLYQVVTDFIRVNRRR